MLENIGLVTVHLTALQAEGVQVALDDFGTGDSSFSWLARLPIDILKLDRALLTKARTILTQTAALAALLRLRVVFEDTEKLDTLPLLQELSVRLGQGDLFGRFAPFGVSFGQFQDSV